MEVHDEFKVTAKHQKNTIFLDFEESNDLFFNEDETEYPEHQRNAGVTCEYSILE